MLAERHNLSEVLLANHGGAIYQQIVLLAQSFSPSISMLLDAHANLLATHFASLGRLLYILLKGEHHFVMLVRNGSLFKAR